MELSQTDKLRIQQANARKRIILPDGTELPKLGQGTWNMGDDLSKRQQEIEALRLGVELGMTVIDTAEMYGEGKSEEMVGEALKDIRNQVFLVSKVYPHNASKEKIKEACENSLRRLKTEFLDLYLLHWRGSVPLKDVVEGMEQLKEEGKIKRWGVSNFDASAMEELLSIPGGENCQINQVLYHLGSRGIEYELIPWHESHQIPLMAYSPLAQGGDLNNRLLSSASVNEIGEKYGASPQQILLAWAMHKEGIMAIPKSGNPTHTASNGASVEINFTEEELKELDRAFPAPNHRTSLDII